MRALLALAFALMLLPSFALAVDVRTTEQCTCTYLPAAATESVYQKFTDAEWVARGVTVDAELCQKHCASYAAENNGTFQSAAYEKIETEVFKGIVPELGVAIPGFAGFQNPLVENGVLKVNFIGAYVNAIYRWLIGVMALFAVVMIMVGGIQYMLRGGSQQGVTEAKARITNALVGMVILLGSYVLLYTTNPQLTIFAPLEIKPVFDRPLPLGGLGMLAHPELATTEAEFRALGCPTKAEFVSGVEFFATAYYKPAYDEKVNYKSFWCNIGMQCSCPGSTGRSETDICTVPSGYSWGACNYFPEGTPYCNHMKYKKDSEPEPFVSAAVSTCISPGTLFKVFGSGNGKTESATWRADDKGGLINGRRIDLFVGTGQAALNAARGTAGKVTIKTCPQNDPSQCPTN